MRDVVLLVDRDGSRALAVGSVPQFRNTKRRSFHLYIEYALSQTVEVDGIIYNICI